MAARAGHMSASNRWLPTDNPFNRSQCLVDDVSLEGVSSRPTARVGLMDR